MSFTPDPGTPLAQYYVQTQPRIGAVLAQPRDGQGPTRGHDQRRGDGQPQDDAAPGSRPRKGV